MLLFFDTETTGIINFKAPSDTPGQPHLVQLGYQLYPVDGTRPFHSACFIIKPCGFTISKEATAIHGITNELACDIGVDLKWALLGFTHFLTRASLVIAHNIDFDHAIIQIEWKRCGIHFCQRPLFCTMHASTDVLKLPGNYGNYKWPKLSEAYEFFTKTPLSNAHDALVDVTACKAVFDGLKKLKVTPNDCIKRT